MFSYAIPFDQAITMIQKAGFEVVSIGGKGSVYATAKERSKMTKRIEANGMTVDSVHAPFPEGDQLFSLNEDERLESIRQCQTALDTAAELDGRTVAIHLIQPYGIPEGEIPNKMIEQGRRSVGVLAAYAARQGVTLALENGQKREYDHVLEHLLTEFDDEHVGLCYDTGHENVQGTCFRLLEEYGHRLLTLHIHDKTGSDTHMLPYEGTIDWDLFRDKLHRLDYSASLSVESHMPHSRFKDPVVFLTEARKRTERLLQHRTG